ncbi:MAG TPA: hypothetical protein VIT44_07555 [Cyclobacteriaceae bacterium]
MNSLKTILLSIVILCTFRIYAQTADDVISGYVKFIGGEKNWSKIKTITTSGEYNYGGAAFPFTTLSKAPNQYKFIVPFNGKHYTQAFDGIKGWKIDAFKGETQPTSLSGKPAIALANEADVELEDAFINYKSKGHQAVLEGKENIESKECFKVKFMRKNGDIETYYFDTKTYALVQKNAISKNVEMEGALFNTTFSDYRNVKGIKIPFKAISKSNGQTILTITIDKVELNKPIADSEFQPNN